MRSLGQLTSATDASGSTTAVPITITASYDGFDRLAKTRQKAQSDVNRGFSTFGYDRSSNLTRRQDNGIEDPAGLQLNAPRTLDFLYDAANWREGI